MLAAQEENMRTREEAEQECYVQLLEKQVERMAKALYQARSEWIKHNGGESTPYDNLLPTWKRGAK